MTRKKCNNQMNEAQRHGTQETKEKYTFFKYFNFVHVLLSEATTLRRELLILIFVSFSCPCLMLNRNALCSKMLRTQCSDEKKIAF